MDINQRTNDNNAANLENNGTSMMIANTSPLLKSTYHTDVLRLIGQYLNDVGLNQTASSLLHESGLNQLDHPVAVKFKEYILAGEWDRASSLVEDVARLSSLSPIPSSSASRQQLISPSNHQPTTSSRTTIATRASTNNKQQNGCISLDSTAPATSFSASPSNAINVKQQQLRSNIIAMRFALAEQKFLELIDENERIKALRCLRCELTPCCRDEKRIQFFTTLLMCKSQDEIRLKANWQGKGQVTRRILLDKLTSLIPPVVMLPPKRLETLLTQAVQFQTERCILHLKKSPANEQSICCSTNNNDAERSSSTRHSSSSSCKMSSSGSLDKRNSLRTIISVKDFLGCDGHCGRATSLAQCQQHSQSSSLMNNNRNGSTNTRNTINVHSANCSSEEAKSDPQTSGGDDHDIDFNCEDEDNITDDNDNCLNHDYRQIDLKTDHLCSADDFPLQSRQVLDSHNSEVWFCRFSNDGTKLATGGLGGKIKIWNLDNNRRTLVEKCTFDCNSYSISCLDWSPNDVYLLACGSDDQPDLWIWNVVTEQMQQMISRTDIDSFTTCSWHMTGERFAAASIRGTFNIYDLNGNKCGTREGVRVQCLSFLHKNPNLVLAADTLNRIKGYEVKESQTNDMISLKYQEVDILEEKHPIISFVVDREDRRIAVNVKKQGIHLWDLPSRSLLRVFLGVTQRNMTIYSSFSSPNTEFLASGSEDGKVYIYHVDKDQPVAILNGHSRCVNCVTWNEKYPELLVSVSDDKSIRLWAPMEPRSAYHLCRSISRTGLLSHYTRAPTIHLGGDSDEQRYYNQLNLGNQDRHQDYLQGSSAMGSASSSSSSSSTASGSTSTGAQQQPQAQPQSQQLTC